LLFDERQQQGPVSSPVSMIIAEMPVSLSPAWIARWIGAAPRHRGNKDAWPFKQPNRGMAKIVAGNNSP
jgi:hypothetical protein